jgi:putative transposase
VRPATPLICAFIDDHQQRYGVAPICRALAVHGIQIAPRTYWVHRAAAPSKRALWDTTITEILAGLSAQTGSAGAVVAGRKVGNAFAT